MIGESWAAHCRRCDFAGAVIVLGVAEIDPRTRCTPCPTEGCGGYVQLLAPLEVFQGHELSDSTAHPLGEAGCTAATAMQRWSELRMWERWPPANASRYLALITCEGQGSDATPPDLRVTR